MELFASHFGTYEVDRTDGAPRLKPFRFDPEPSAIGAAYLDLADNAARVLHPMVRRSVLDRPDEPSGHLRGREPFVAVDWDVALDLVARKVAGVRSRFGNRAIFGGSYGWSSAGRFHHASSQLKRFLNLVGGFTLSVNSYSFGAAEVLLPHIIGAEFCAPGAASPTWDRIVGECRLIVGFGGFRLSNAQVSGGGAAVHRARAWLDRALAAGLRIVVFSADGTDAADDPRVEHVPIRPNSDAAVMLAMAHVLLVEGQADLDFLNRCTVGHVEFLAYLRGEADGQPKDPHWASALSGVPAERIAELARALAGLPSLINLSWSLQRARFGEQPYWASIALAAMAGHVGRSGCGFSFGLTATGSIGQPIRPLGGPSIDQGRNPVADFIPVARIAELLERPGGTIDYDGQRLDLPRTELVWWAGGNPFHHHQDLNRLRRAWERPETIIVNEPVWTATARLADIVLPSSLPIERNDISAGSRDNWIIASRQVVPPRGQTRNDFEIFSALAARFGLAEAFTEGRDEDGWLRHIYQGYRDRNPSLPDFDAFWAAGYATVDSSADPRASQQPLADFVADPAAHPLATPSGRIEIGSQRIAGFGYADCPGHPMWIAPEEWLGAPLASDYPLHLLSPQPSTRLHSQLEAAGPSRAARIAGHEAARFHPGDAADRGIRDGDVVRLFNARGSTLVGAILDHRLTRGVVSLPTGATWTPDGASEGLDLAGNPNALTSDIGVSRLSQGPASGSCLIEAERFEADAAASANMSSGWAATQPAV